MLVVALGVVIASAGTAWAAGNASITINNSVSGEQYTYYKILDASIASKVTTDPTTGQITDGNVSYTVDSQTKADALGSLTVSDSVNTKIFTVESSGSKWNVSINKALTDQPDGEVMAEKLGTILSSFGDGTNVTSTGSTVTISDLDPGYYYITSSLGTKVAVQTVGNVTINEKNDKPSTTKKVEKSNYSVGDYVHYTITVNLPASIDYTKKVTVHDTMDNVLTVNSNKRDTSNAYGYAVTVRDASLTSGGDDFSKHTDIQGNLTANHNSSNHKIGANQVGYDFVLDISSLAPTGGQAASAKVITIDYYAELKDTARADTNYSNKEYVSYSNYETPTQDVEIKTFDFDLNKTFNGTTSQGDLQATFQLKKAGSEDSPIRFKENDLTDSEKYTAEYVKADSTDTSADPNLVLIVHGGEKGINIRGLDAGDYELTETATAPGYNLLVNSVTFTIDENGNIKNPKNGNEDMTATDNKITVVNNAGSVLPSTGGMGTTAFYIVGGVLIVGAIAYLAHRRKANANA